MSDLSNDLDELSQNSVGPRNKQCGVEFVLGQVDEESRLKLVALLDNDQVSGAQICKVLTSHGFAIQYSSVIRHRRRLKGNAGCKCP